MSEVRTQPHIPRLAALVALFLSLVASSCGRRDAAARKEDPAGSASPKSWRWVGTAPIDIHGRECEPIAWLPPDSRSSWEAEARRHGANVVCNYDPTTSIARLYKCNPAVLDTLMGPEAEKTRPADLAPPSAELIQRCERDHEAEACLEAADRSKDNDYEREDAFLEKACEAGLPVGCFLLARKVRDEAPARAKGMAVYERRCKGGDHGACKDAAVIYRKGLGIPADPAKAKALLESP